MALRWQRAEQVIERTGAGRPGGFEEFTPAANASLFEKPFYLLENRRALVRIRGIYPLGLHVAAILEHGASIVTVFAQGPESLGTDVPVVQVMHLLGR